ncbi:MAG: DMT family transporter [Xanthobacteraceae bacterium]|nr:DMT family transporter [Xanthobacteraceae bacterium]
MTRIRADLLLFACAAIWGFAFLFQKSAMDHIGPFTFVGSRALLATLVLAPFAFLEHRRSTVPVTGAYLRTGIFAGLAFVTGAVLQQAGLVTASVTNTAFLTALYVVATPFISFALTGKPVAPLIWFAVGLSFVGTWLLGGGTLTTFGVGDILVALSACFWALHMVIAGVAAPMGRSVLFSVVQFSVVSVTALAGAALFETVTTDSLRAALSNILYVGVLSTAMSFTILTFALRATSPSEAAIIIMTETLFAAFGAWLFFHEGLSLVGACGAAAILSAAAIVQLQQVHAARRK